MIFALERCLNRAQSLFMKCVSYHTNVDIYIYIYKWLYLFMYKACSTWTIVSFCTISDRMQLNFFQESARVQTFMIL